MRRLKIKFVGDHTETVRMRFSASRSWVSITVTQQTAISSGYDDDASEVPRRYEQLGQRGAGPRLLESHLTSRVAVQPCQGCFACAGIACGSRPAVEFEPLS
jgi:hypothetical protein